jgi:hypothetical protein
MKSVKEVRWLQLRDLLPTDRLEPLKKRTIGLKAQLIDDLVVFVDLDINFVPQNLHVEALQPPILLRSDEYCAE